jgi:hypothetical protein
MDSEEEAIEEADGDSSKPTNQHRIAVVGTIQQI